MKVTETIRQAALGVGAILAGCGLMVADMKIHAQAEQLWSAAKLVVRHGVKPAASALFDARDSGDSEDDDEGPAPRACKTHVLVLREGHHLIRIAHAEQRCDGLEVPAAPPFPG